MGHENSRYIYKIGRYTQLSERHTPWAQKQQQYITQEENHPTASEFKEINNDNDNMSQ
jgi:hypothetical protein